MSLVDRAREAANNATPGPWKTTKKHAVTDRHGWSIFVDEENGTSPAATRGDARLAALAPEMAAFITGLRQQWAVEVTLCAPTSFIEQKLWLDYRETADDHLAQTRRKYSTGECRLVSRWVSEPEVTE